MRKKLTIAAVLVIMLALVAAGTWAYFTANGQTTNYITTGKIEMALSEKMMQGGNEVDYYKGVVTGIMPGNTQSKIVRIENSGTEAFWTRVKVDIDITAADKSTLPNTLAGSTGSIVSLNCDGTQWEYNDADGCYYCKTPVEAGDTVTLFTEVTFAPAMGNQYQGCTVDIAINAQAVQYKNNADGTAQTYSDAAGWPEWPTT